MAITYNIARCRKKKGWGVYLRAISGDDLKIIAPTCSASVVRVKSGRLARKRTKEAAKNYINRLKAEPIEAQRERLLSRTWIRLAPKAYKVVRVQNLRLYREMPSGTLLPSTISVNRSYLEKLALHYTERNLKSFLRKGVTKYLKLPLDTPTNNLNII